MVVFPTIALVIMMLMIMCMIRILSNAAVEYDIRQDLKHNVNRNARNVSIEQGKVIVDEEFSYKEDDIYYLVVKRKGKILYGNYPDEVVQEMTNFPIRRNHTRDIVLHGKKWFVRDVRIGIPGQKKVFVRGIVKKADAQSHYRSMEIFAYLCVVGISAIIFMCEWTLSRRISKELKDMCITAEGIGKSLDMSRRMDYDGRFREIAVLTQANNRMLDSIEQTFLQQEQFNSDVSHELRTPVAVMLAECQSVQKENASREELKESIEVIYRQSAKVHTIINQLLYLSRLEQGRAQIHFEDVDLVELVQCICEDIQDKSEENVLFRLNLNEVHASGDINLVMIVIENFIRNALKFGPANGPVDITTGSREDAVFVSVKDYGKGISKEEQENIFKRFYKGDKSRNTEGFGLGLSLSMKIAEVHGGSIELESEEGKGSKFSLILKKY